MRAVLFLIAALTVTTAAKAEQVWLTMDQVRPIKLENPAQSIVVGNPAIADVTVQDNQNILLFGKAPGLTNIYIFDEKGDAANNLVIRVRSPNTDMLTLQRGIARMTFNCTTNCEATTTVGDDQFTFNNVAQQVQNKFQQAQQATAAADNN